jgi:hypothetical protein
MPRERNEWPSRVKAIEREYKALRLAAHRLVEQARDDPNILSKNAANKRDAIKLRDLSNASHNLEGTYLVRLFAEFETGLRLYWATIKATHPRMEDLVNGVASKRRISDDLISTVHSVREYRNSLVHEREDEINPVPLSAARSCICEFLSRLPENWS